MTPDYYTLLGVAPGAEDEIIRAAYLVLAKRYHPDTATAASPHNVEKFRLIAEAYEVLRDPRRRAYYDWCHAEQNSAQQIQGERSQEEQEHREVRAPAKSTWSSAIDNPLVYSAGAVALVVALLFGLIKVIAPNGPSANTDVAMRTEKSERSSSFLSDKAALQELTDLRRTLQQTERLAATNQESLAQERARRQELEKQLAARATATSCWRRNGPAPGTREALAARGDNDKLLAQERARSQELEKQLAARGDNDKLLAQERARSQELEKQLAARGDNDKLLAQERARSQELEKQLAARGDNDKLLAQERARSQELEKQLAARGDNDKLLAQERARSQELEKQLAARGDNDKLLAQERARSQGLEQQLAARGDNEKLLAQERARSQGLEKQLAARGDNDKLLAQERARSQELEKQLAARGDNDKLLAQERARSQELEKQLAARGDNDKLLAQERARSQGLEQQLAARGDNDKLLAQERARSQGLEKQLAARGDNDKLLAQERARSQELEKQLAARGDNEKLLAQERARSQELEKQLAARGDNDKLLAQERARSQELEKQLAARGDNEKLLAQERARSQELEKQLAARQHATPAHGHNVIASLSDTSHPTPPPTNESATAPLPRSDKPVIPAVDNPATLAARPEAPGNPEAAGLMARARVLLGQGNIGVARIVLERAAEMGSAPALFALAETYDPAILSAWGTLGTQGDVGKAQELYAKAFASGVREAKDRLNALRY